MSIAFIPHMQLTMKVSNVSVFITFCLLLWAPLVQACHEDRLQVVGSNVYLMSQPRKNSRVLLKLPAQYSDLKGCVSGKAGRDYKTDKSGNRWYYVGFNEENDRRINGWVMAKKTKVILNCCQAG
jgi:hypothetical protein